MSRIKRIIIFLNLLLLLVYFNCAVLNKEKILTDGKLILLELAPVDPRSLMQGDFMRLNYAITGRITGNERLSKRGYCVVRLDSLGVGQLIRYQGHQKPLEENEYLIEYALNDWDMNIGAESFFFQEGTGKHFEKAKYGALRVDAKGNSVLIGLYDVNRQLIEAPEEK